MWNVRLPNPLYRAMPFVWVALSALSFGLDGIGYVAGVFFAAAAIAFTVVRRVAKAGSFGENSNASN